MNWKQNSPLQEYVLYIDGRGKVGFIYRPATGPQAGKWGATLLITEIKKETFYDTKHAAQAALEDAYKELVGAGGILPPALSEALNAAESAYPDVALKAVQTLGELRDPRAIVGLSSIVKNHARGVRQQAARALGNIAHKDSVNALVLALSDYDGNVRIAAARALASQGESMWQTEIIKGEFEDFQRLRTCTDDRIKQSWISPSKVMGLPNNCTLRNDDIAHILYYAEKEYRDRAYHALRNSEAVHRHIERRDVLTRRVSNPYWIVCSTIDFQSVHSFLSGSSDRALNYVESEAPNYQAVLDQSAQCNALA